MREGSFRGRKTQTLAADAPAGVGRWKETETHCTDEPESQWVRLGTVFSAKLVSSPIATANLVENYSL